MIVHADGKADMFEIYKGKVSVGGRRVQDVPKGNEYGVQLEVALNQIIVRVNGAVMHSMADPARTLNTGKLVFVGDKGDPMGVSDFRFSGR